VLFESKNQGHLKSEAVNEIAEGFPPGIPNFIFFKGI
jgi:hypothetical protein